MIIYDMKEEMLSAARLNAEVAWSGSKPPTTLHPKGSSLEPSMPAPHRRFGKPENP